jgi:hypothetical protein
MPSKASQAFDRPPKVMEPRMQGFHGDGARTKLIMGDAWLQRLKGEGKILPVGAPESYKRDLESPLNCLLITTASSTQASHSFL